jgi:uncharacterized membrane protein YcaP (DUF421 family)
MLVDMLWKTVLVFVAGALLLRIAGRKSIAQLTVYEQVIMIGLGSLLVQPLVGKGLWDTLYAGSVLVLSMIVWEFLQVKFDFLETLFTGKAVVVIENGAIRYDNMKKLRMSVDQLEKRLRQHGISNIGDIQIATIEVSGQLGVELKPGKQPATKEDIQKVLDAIEARWPGQHVADLTKADPLAPDLFRETKNPVQPDIPKQWQ